VAGLYSLIQTRIGDGSFGLRFPAQCPDGTAAFAERRPGHACHSRPYSRADLVAVIGSKARAADLLNGKREINLDQLRKLSKAWNIPVGSLIGEVAA